MRILRLMAPGWLIGVGSILLASSSEAQPVAPKVIVAWAGALMEVRVAFDQAVDPEVARLVVGQSIEFGDGEKPGVAGRLGGDRGTLKVAAARLIDNGRTLVLVTDPHPREATYRLAIPGVKVAGSTGSGAKVSIQYDLGGVEVVSTDGDKKWSGWWPVLDASEVRKLTSDSVEHDRLWTQTQKSDTLTLQTLVSTPRGDVSIDLDASTPFEVTFGTESAKSAASKPDGHRASLKVEANGEPIFLSLTFPDVKGAPGVLRVSINGQNLARSAFVLPWAPSAPSASPLSAIPPQLLTGGDPVRGQAVFFGEQAKCSNCHQAGGKGGVIGPELASLAGRDRAWVYQNIIEPSASIHPNYVSYTVAMKDGRIAMGVVRAEGADAVKVSDIDAKQSIIPRAEIEEIRPSSSSIMPVGLLGAIGDDNTRDLLAFLTAQTQKPSGR
jgi:putative heme-binding domain-containing protein